MKQRESDEARAKLEQQSEALPAIEREIEGLHCPNKERHRQQFNVNVTRHELTYSELKGSFYET